jgi:hypothetical protein
MPAQSARPKQIRAELTVGCTCPVTYTHEAHERHVLHDRVGILDETSQARLDSDLDEPASWDADRLRRRVAKPGACWPAAPQSTRCRSFSRFNWQSIPDLLAYSAHAIGCSSPEVAPMYLAPFALALAVVGQCPADWYEPFPAHRVVGNVYYVGSKDLATYLVTTPEGHILINSGLERTVPLIQKSIESLGFKITDVKILLASHAHSDHVAGHALLQKLNPPNTGVLRGGHIRPDVRVAVNRIRCHLS